MIQRNWQRAFDMTQETKDFQSNYFTKQIIFLVY